MPYTPPAQRSPAASANSSPNISRRSSYQPGYSAPPPSSRPELPRSTSYLTRQRRAAAAKKPSFADEPTPPSTADNEKKESGSLLASGAIRQSPPPITEDSKIPAGAIISPPDSAQNSSDDEELKVEGSRGRELENLAELQAAIRIIEQHKESSPTRTAEDVLKANQVLSLVVPDEEASAAAVIEQTLSNGLGMRKIAHNRSKTDTSVPVYVDMRGESAIETPANGSEDDSEDELTMRRKPQMLRKKSGELVRPALRPSSARRRPSSMPGTPTYGKAVHFDQHLEHVRHFLQVDRPLAVSAGSSPIESHDSDSEFPFDSTPSGNRSPPFEWEIVISNFPGENPIRLSQPVRVERVFLSADNKTLVGSVAVANLAFNKWVVARFTLDYWKTTSEVVAEFNHDVRQPKLPDGRDRFNFNIKLADLANLEAKTMFFCVKYCVNGQEHWDNNDGHNFQVDFRKKAKPQNGKKGMQGAASRPANSLPRSRKSPVLVNGKPKVPVAFDDFGDGFDQKYNLDFKQPVSDYLGDDDNNPIRLKGVKSAVTLSSTPTLKKSNPNGQAFGNRYDFGASLSAAINAANTALGDKSGIVMKSPAGKRPTPKQAQDVEQTVSPLTMTSPQPFVPARAKAAATPPTALGPEVPPLASQSYSELLDKYCFFGSSKNSPQLKDGTLKSGQFDGANDDAYLLASPSSSSDSSPVMMEQRASPPRSQLSRSTSPAPMTGLVTGTSSMYPNHMHGGFQFYDAHTVTAIRG